MAQGRTGAHAYPGIAHDGPKAMLINQYSSSGGDAFPTSSARRNGTIIGTRTWGGLVGISGNAGLVDGGYISVPRFGIYNSEGQWVVEGVGVYPDIEVIDARTCYTRARPVAGESGGGADEATGGESSQNGLSPPIPTAVAGLRWRLSKLHSTLPYIANSTNSRYQAYGRYRLFR